jgi:hypothetical protein
MQETTMSDELEKLKRDYQSINAPPHLAMRIAGSVADSRTRSGFWMPAAVACTAVLAMLWMIPITNQVANDVSEKPSRPSLTALAALKPSKPSVSTPSLSQLRTVTVPSMPAKPKPTKTPKPQSNNRIENESLKEKDNVYI